MSYASVTKKNLTNVHNGRNVIRTSSYGSHNERTKNDKNRVQQCNTKRRSTRGSGIQVLKGRDNSMAGQGVWKGTSRACFAAYCRVCGRFDGCVGKGGRGQIQPRGLHSTIQKRRQGGSSVFGLAERKGCSDGIGCTDAIRFRQVGLPCRALSPTWTSQIPTTWKEAHAQRAPLYLLYIKHFHSDMSRYLCLHRKDGFTCETCLQVWQEERLRGMRTRTITVNRSGGKSYEAWKDALRYKGPQYMKCEKCGAYHGGDCVTLA